MFSVNFWKVNVFKNILEKFSQIMCLAEVLISWDVWRLSMSIYRGDSAKIAKILLCHMGGGGRGATYGESSFYLQLKCQMYKQFFLYKYDET